MSTEIQERRTFEVSTDTGKFAIKVLASTGANESRAQVREIAIRGFAGHGEPRAIRGFGEPWAGATSPIVVVIRDSDTIQPLRDLRDALNEAIQFCEGHGLA